VRNHLQMANTLVEGDTALRNLVRQVVDLKQELAQSIVTRLQRIMSVQRLIKDCKKTHNVTAYFEHCRQAVVLHERVQHGLRLPYTYIWTLHEIARRIPFAKHYREAAIECYARLNQLRQSELKARRDFYIQHGQYLPLETSAFEFLDDYPHTCMVKPRSFDTDLPIVSIDDVKLAISAIETEIDQNQALQQLIQEWAPLSKAAELDVDCYAEPESAAQGESEQVAALQEQVLLLHCECEVLETDKDVLQSQAAAADAQLAAVKQEAKALAAKVAELQQQMAKYGHANNASTTSNSNTISSSNSNNNNSSNSNSKGASSSSGSSAAEALHREKQALAAQLSEQTSRLEEAQQQLAETINANEELQAKHSQSIEEGSALRKQMQALEAKESALQNQCRDMEKLTGAHAKLSAQKDEAEQRSKELAERAGSQQRDLDKLKQQCAAAEDTGAKLHKQVVELELKLAARSHTTSKDAATATPSFVAGSMSASAADWALSSQESGMTASTLTSSLTGPPPHISFRAFKVGDLALFIPWRKNLYLAYHRGAPYHIMTTKSQQALGFDWQERICWFGSLASHSARLR
jgi:uncharacterized coiled-coil protein SlyX